MSHAAIAWCIAMLGIIGFAGYNVAQEAENTAYWRGHQELAEDYRQILIEREIRIKELTETTIAFRSVIDACVTKTNVTPIMPGAQMEGA